MIFFSTKPAIKNLELLTIDKNKNAMLMANSEYMIILMFFKSNFEIIAFYYAET